eukprot:c17759_g1_i1 orf=152-1222(-)
MECMAKALIAKFIPKLLGETHPWTLYFWSFIDSAKRGLANSWQHMTREELILSDIPLSIKHSSLFDGILKAIKEASKQIWWTGKPDEEVDSSLSHSFWWHRSIIEGVQLGIKYKKEEMLISRKGLYLWRHLWDGNRGTWRSAEVLRQSFKLSTGQTQIIKEILEQIPEWFPTNWVIARSQPEKEWSWQNGDCLRKTSTHTVYMLLSKEDMWYISLNKRWKRREAVEWWRKRCFKIWKGTPFPSINLWNWRMLSGSVLTGEKMRARNDISRLCLWCKTTRETLIHVLWACPAIKTYWNTIRKKLIQAFGQVKVAAHMILLGNIRFHYEELSFCWHLVRAVYTSALWTARNMLLFQQK